MSCITSPSQEILALFLHIAQCKSVQDAPSTPKPELPKWKRILPSLASGALAGACAKTTIAPLDRCKINFQVSKTRRYSFREAFRFVIRTYRTDGFLALYRGNSATMARVVPYAAIQFAAHEEYKRLLRVDRDGTTTPARRYISGSLAALTSTTMTYPLDTAKACLSVSDKTIYPNLRSVFRIEYKKHGFWIFYRGLGPTLLGVIPYAGSSFFTYETLKLLYKEEFKVKAGPIMTMLMGSFAGLVGQSSSYPLDIVRRRMQTGRVPANQGVIRTLVNIAREEGIVRGWYKGLSMNWVKGPIAVGITFTTYDHVIPIFRSLVQ